MNDEFSKAVERIKRIQAMALDNPEIIELATLFAKLHCRTIEDEIRDLQQADPISLANAYYAQLNEEQAQDAIDAARRGDRSHIEERAEAGLTTPAEKPFLFGKKFMGRPPTIRTRDELIVATIEALRASGLKKAMAIAKAGRAWGRHLNLTESTVEDVYKTNKLAAAQAEAVREFFSGATVEEVLEAIEDYCHSELTRHK